MLANMLSLSCAAQTHQTHLHSQLAQLSANLADTESLLRMTSVQAECMRGLGSWHAALYANLLTMSYPLHLLFPVDSHSH